MNIQQALDRIDSIKPNMVMQDIKVQWLSELDDMIRREIVEQHHKDNRPHHPWRPPDRPIDGRYPWPGNPLEQLVRPPEAKQRHDKPRMYDPEGDLSVELLVPFPYDKIYQYYLAMQIDIVTAELDKFNNDNALFNTAYMEFSDWYTRNHMPIQKVRQFGL